MPDRSRSSRIRRWIEERLGLEGLGGFLAKKSVPLHRHSMWYYLGGMTLFLFLIQVVTGVLLLLYYKPTAESAYESVRYIMAEVRFGWLIRSLHSWSANLMVGAAFVHMFSVFFLKAYRPPRELTWITGTLLLFICMGFGFSGYLLPWNELAYFATKVGTEIIGSVPLIGKWLLVVLRGGENVTGATLTRFFAIHIFVLPAAFVVVLGFHLLLVQRLGMSEPLEWRTLDEETKRRRSMPFIPNFLLRDIMGWLMMVMLLVLLASLFPWEIGKKADAFASAPAGIRPEWYFVFMFYTLKLVPAHVLGLPGETVAVLAFAAAGLLWLFVPFFDRKSLRQERSPGFTILGLIVVLFIVVMTVLEYAG